MVGPRRDMCVNGETLRSFTAGVYARRPLQRLLSDEQSKEISLTWLMKPLLIF